MVLYVFLIELWIYFIVLICGFVIDCSVESRFVDILGHILCHTEYKT